MAKKRSSPKPKAAGTKALATEQTFLGEILAEPEEDAPRLRYADWLAANGQPERAEFIRLQIERARRPRGDASRLAPTDRERDLLAAHGEQWLAPLPEAARRCVSFERGFPGRAEPELIDFLDWDDRLWQVAPVTALRLVDTVLGSGDYRPGLDREREMLALAAKPQLAHIRTLDLNESGYFFLADLRTLMTSPYLAGVRDLTVGEIGLGPPAWGGACDEIISVLDQAKNLASLRVLNLESNAITDEGVELLLASSFLGHLTELVLGNNDITDVGAERLASSPRLASLECLHLYCNPIGDRGARALAASPHLRNLKEISFMASDLSAEVETELREQFGDRLQL